MDPKLEPAIKEIKAILEKHDIAGVILLSSKTHTDSYHHFWPTWSCARMEGPFLRIKSTHLPPDQKQEILKNTVGMIAGFVDAANVTVESCSKLLEVIGTKVQFSHISRQEPPSTAQ